MITSGQLEVLVALVLGLDAVVIAGIVVSRLAGRRSNRHEAEAVAVQHAPYLGNVASEPSEPRPMSAAPEAPPAEAPAQPAAPQEATAQESPAIEPAAGGSPAWLGLPAAATAAMADPPPSVAELESAGFEELAPPPSEPESAGFEELAPPPSEPESAGFEELAPPPSEPESAAFEELASPPSEPESAMSEELPASFEAPEVPFPMTRPGSVPAGFDFGPTWVDPLDMAAMAAAKWRHALRRDLARAAHRGRSAMVMHLQLDIESKPELAIQELAYLEGLLLDLLTALIRASDHVDRTGPGRFHMILSGMPEAGAVAVADRIRQVFAGDVPDGPRLLIGWAAMETEADIALALQRAAERVDDGNGSIRSGDVRG